VIYIYVKKKVCLYMWRLYWLWNCPNFEDFRKLCFILRMDLFEQKLKLMMNHTTCGPWSFLWNSTGITNFKLNLSGMFYRVYFPALI